jgi:uncharacterized membrane protein
MEVGIVDRIISYVGQAIDTLGIGIIAITSVAQLGRHIRALARHRSASTYRSVRAGVGRGILLGLEFLVAGDVIRTVGGNSSLRSLALLASVVGIRTFLSFTIGVEDEGHWPWESRSP